MTRKTGVLVKTVNHVKRSPYPTRRENEIPTKNGEKQDQREILKGRDVRQVHNKRRVEVDCQNLDSLKEDVCSCLAHKGCCLFRSCRLRHLGSSDLPDTHCRGAKSHFVRGRKSQTFTTGTTTRSSRVQ